MIFIYRQRVFRFALPVSVIKFLGFLNTFLSWMRWVKLPRGMWRKTRDELRGGEGIAVIYLLQYSFIGAAAFCF